MLIDLRAIRLKDEFSYFSLLNLLRNSKERLFPGDALIIILHRSSEEGWRYMEQTTCTEGLRLHYCTDRKGARQWLETMRQASSRDEPGSAF